jgi:hypothetical protein
MSPNGQPEVRKIPDNLYTAIIALAFGVVLATALCVAYICYTQYGLFGLSS